MEKEEVIEILKLNYMALMIGHMILLMLIILSTFIKMGYITIGIEIIIIFYIFRIIGKFKKRQEEIQRTPKTPINSS